MELQNRIARGWAKFGVYKSELTDKRYPLKQRLRLFESIITPTVLYGSGSWAMTVERERVLQSAQRRMMRKILGSGRKEMNVAEDSSNTTDSEGQRMHLQRQPA